MIRRAALIVMFVISASFVLGRTAQSADIRLVVILASGINSASTGWGNDWKDVQAALKQAGRGEVEVRPYSYADKATYEQCDTNQLVSASAAALDGQVEDLRKEFPGTKMMVVGHSLGGVVATYWKATDPGDLEGLDWADTDQTLLSGLGAKLYSIFNCDSFIPFELKPTSGVVSTMAKARSARDYFNIASRQDRVSARSIHTLSNGTTSRKWGPGPFDRLW